ncbi:nuclear transport factor 2 family protein [Streptomyces fulvoviolaceus]|uniref:nuclear transport factor 2 family protein n=1 Tax=Streptomyces fulvoviolaceus TaxID=285535 RepID=UPI0005B8CEA0|nr:nuclear transport factor 2 family protein [Streptomyces fulvoviolaceus]
MTPTETVSALIERFSAGEMEAALELYADDVELSIEFGLPERFVIPDKASLVAGMKAAQEAQRDKPSRMYADIEVRDLVIHETVDPNTVIAEWTYVSRIEDASVSNRNIIVVECRDGKIVRSRDYHNDVTRAVAEGTVPKIVAAIEGMALPKDQK